MIRAFSAILLLAALLVRAPVADAAALQHLARFFRSEMGQFTWRVFVDSRELRHATRSSILEAQRLAGLRPDPLMTYPELLQELSRVQAAGVDDLASFASLRERLVAFNRASAGNGWRAAAARAGGRLPPEAGAWLREELRPWSRQFGRTDFIGGRPNLQLGLREYMVWQEQAAADSVQRYRFHAGEFEDIRDLSLRILDLYPPSRFAYVGVGRSPTPVMRFIQEWSSLSGRQAVTANVPFTKPSVLGGGIAEIPDAAMSAHLDRFLPTAEALSGRELVVIDLVSGGKGLQLFESKLAGFASSRPGFPRHRVLAIEERPGAAAALGIDGIGAIPLGDYPVLRTLLVNSSYDRVARYGAHRVGMDPADAIRPRRSHDVFGAVLRERMEVDPAFRQ